jgi:hypothetical protein
VLATLLANVGTLVAFRTAPADAATLAPLLPPFAPGDLTALPARHCYLRTTSPGPPWTVSAATLAPSPPRRDEAGLAALAAARRLPGRPLRLPGSPRAMPASRAAVAALPEDPRPSPGRAG